MTLNTLDVLHGGFFVERHRLPLDDRNGIVRTFAQAGPQPVAEQIGDEFRFAIDDLDGPFGTGGHTEPASVALLFIDPDDLTCWHFRLAWSGSGGR